MGKVKTNPKLIIAGPGAGKTHNMVDSIVNALPELSDVRYMAVITYTNAAANNIYQRVAKRISIPNNLFIGTMHSFLNKFIVMPFASFGGETVAREKLFIQCDLDAVFLKVESMKAREKRAKTPKESAIIKKAIRQKLNTKGYITFDQTLALAKDCLSNAGVCKALCNRLQYLFVDEFQDSGNEVFGIIESIRKQGKTKIYCVGDPEQYIQSFDSSIRSFLNIPILKAAASISYDIEINNSNYRSTVNIVTFLNRFNGRTFKSGVFRQEAKGKDGGAPDIGEDILFSPKWGSVTPIIEDFYLKCDILGIPVSNRCILAKKNDVTNRVAAAVNNHFMNPKKGSADSTMKMIQDTLLATLRMNQTGFCDKYKTTVYTLRKYVLAIYRAISDGVITNENTYGKFLKEVLKLEMVEGLPVKIENLKPDHALPSATGVVTLCNIHTIKGLEAAAVLAIAKTQEELLLWIEIDSAIREAQRDNETTDYPRLGYVAFSRAEKLLCIACLEQVSGQTLEKLKNLGVRILG